MARVTGFGGVFFKSKGGAEQLAAWYQKHLGLPAGIPTMSTLRAKDDPGKETASAVWAVADHDSDWFPGSFMVNYRVDNLAEMLEQLQAGGVEIAQGPETHDNGLFAWVLDPDGNRVELWQPQG